MTEGFIQDIVIETKLSNNNDILNEKDPKKVNHLRKEVGLEPWEEYIEYCNKQQALQKKK